MRFFNTVTNYLQQWYLCNSLSLPSYSIFPGLIVALFPKKHLTFLSKPRLIMFLSHQHYTAHHITPHLSRASIISITANHLNNTPFK